MLKVFTSKYSRDNYSYQLAHLIDFGEPVEVRGRKTIEALNVITEVTEPWHHCIILPARHWNPWLALSEALWILAGRNDIAVLEPYNKRIAEFSDDGETLYGAYGERISWQIDDLLERLRRDPSDRAAVLSIWKPEDLLAKTADRPCNNLLYFKLRSNKLHMTVLCRSNDIHWGLYAVNLPTFGILQVYLAARLGVEVGTQTHLSNSLHIYTDDKHASAITERMMYGDEEAMPLYPKHELAFDKFDMGYIKSHADFMLYCNIVLDTVLKPDIPMLDGCPRFLRFALEFLRLYINNDFYPDLVSLEEKWPAFIDWVQAGQIWTDSR